MNVLNYYIILTQICLINSLIFLLCVSFGKIDVYRHKGAVFLNNFSHTVFIGKFQALFIQEKCDLSPWYCLVSICHLVLCTAITGPVNWYGAFFIGKCINVYLICYHKCRVESKSEMSDHLIICCLIFIFLKKLCSTGKSNLGNIFFYLTDTIINKFQRLLIRIYNNIDSRLVTIRECIITHNFQFSQFGDRITSVGDHLSYKNIMV